MDRILVVKLADLGDVLTATPAIRALRLAHPSAHLAALITPKSSSILEGTDLVDEIIPFEKASFDRPIGAGSALPMALGLARRLRATRWDGLALFHHLTTPFGVAKYAALCLASGSRRIAGLDNGRGRFLTDRVVDEGFGARHEADYWLAVAALLGGHNPIPRFELPVTIADRAWAAEQVRQLGVHGQDGESGAGLLAIHPGSGAFSLARRWPAERFAAVVRGLVRRHGLKPLVIQGPGPDEGLLARTVAVGAGGAAIVGPAPSIGALVALLEHVRLFVGNESGVMHLAVAAGAPIVAIFGPTNDRAWGPYPLTALRHAVVRESLACTPCVHRGHQFGTPAGCAARTCLDLVEPAAVIEAAERVLAATDDLERRRGSRESVALGVQLNMEPRTGSPDAERSAPANADDENAPFATAGPMRCATDSSVETYLRCGRCEKPICPRCLIQTPVGARCRECARLRKLPMFQVGPIDYLRAIGGGLAAGIGGGLALTFIQRLVPIFGMLSIMFLAALGYAVGTAVARSTRRKQGTGLGIIAAFAVPIGLGVGQGLFFIINGVDPTQSFAAGFALLFRTGWGLFGLLIAMAIAFSRAR